MSKSGDQEIGGASIKGRPSIHSHPYCPFAYGETMGRFGLITKKAEDSRLLSKTQPNSQDIDVVDHAFSKHMGRIGLRTKKAEDSRLLSKTQPNSQDIDVVDHAFSKHMNPISSSLIQRNKQRRKSLDENESYEEDSSKLSKSLPATFSLHSYYSNEVSEDEVPLRQENHNSSYQSSTGSPYNISNNRTASGSNLYAPEYTNKVQKIDNKKRSKKIIWTLVLVGVAVTIANMFKQTNTTVSNVYDESKFNNDLYKLGNKYRIDDNAVLQMQTGIATIFERQDTGSFMFVYNSDDDNFNVREFNTFIHDISNVASKYLRNESTPVHYTLVEAASLNMFGHSELISTFREDLDRTGVMLVKHVEAVPSALAMAFHYYCDEYNPLVKKSAIFFTLNLAKCSIDKPTHAAIEKCLAHKWSGVSTDSIKPLLTRVVSVVIDLTEAF